MQYVPLPFPGFSGLLSKTTDDSTATRNIETDDLLSAKGRNTDDDLQSKKDLCNPRKQQIF